MPSTVLSSVSMSVISGVPANISGSAPVTSAMARRLRSPTICVVKRFSTRCALPITPTTGLVIARIPHSPARLSNQPGESRQRETDFRNADDQDQACEQRQHVGNIGAEVLADREIGKAQ